MELIGRRFGHIRVTEVVGQGGMGDVYAGYDEKLERKVALKVLNRDQRLDEEARERLLREARALSKLDHPNICRIHDYIDSGEVDLLVLEYIDGRTLHEASSEKLTHAEKLRIAIAIAEVLIEAHRAGIVHRDLKPENVMLTKSGEVKVLDFGLARWLNHARRSADRNSAARLTVRRFDDVEAMPTGETAVMAAPWTAERPSSSARPELATAVGITLGTPIFMSPEQARGESLTPASDMFSFGLLLQTLFTGEDPHPLGLTAREVILRVARGETLPVQNAPGDVTALINRLKQFAPADRPTAIETVERLRFLQDKRNRIARRGIAAGLALVVSIGAWRYTVDLRTERAAAVAARAEADHRRAQAEDLIEFMLGDLRKKLEPVGRLDVLNDVGERALRYVGSSRPEAMAADELQRGAKALNQLVEVRIAQGRLPDALALARRSLALTRAAAVKQPADPEIQLAQATSHFWVGNVLRLQSDHTNALREISTYSATTQALARRYPDNETYQLESAYGHSVLATMLEAEGKLEEALQHYRSTREVKLARVRAAPRDSERLADLANTDNKIGFVLHRLGRINEARPFFESELQTYSKLVESEPQNVMWQAREGRSRSYMSLALESVGDYSGAVEQTRRELAIHVRIASRDPENAAWQRNVTMSQIRLATLLERTGDLAGAEREYDRGEALSREVLTSSHDVRHRAAAAIQLGRARIHLLRRDYDAAATALHAAREAVRARGAEAEALHPTIPAEVDLLEADLRAARGDRAAARALWSSAERRVASSRQAATEPLAVALRACALARLERHAEAEPLVRQLARAGFRHPWIDSLRETSSGAPQSILQRARR